MGQSYATLSLKNTDDGVYLVYGTCHEAIKGTPEIEAVISKVTSASIYLRVKITDGAMCHFSYSFDGIKFENVKGDFQAEAGRWIGAKVGLFCTRTAQSSEQGYGEFDWFRIQQK